MRYWREITFWVCQRGDTDETRADALKDVDPSTNANPSQWTQLVNYWCSATALLNERERVVVIHVSY